MNENVIQRIVRLLKQQNRQDKELCDFINVSQSTFVNWKKRNTDPKSKYLPDIAEFLGVSEKYLLTGEEITETEAMAEKLHKDPNLRMLFDAADGATPEDLELAAEMLKKMKRNSGYDV
ncbi:helix-turn-helix domain containing protein [bacterium 210820-DFI.6.37]|nr:helix-turn-helix domain containing protein [bacterium 210820-DFI.6.37]